jgi:hypothetical protein
VLTAGSDQAILYASGVLYAQGRSEPAPRDPDAERWPRFDDLTATDDEGRAYALRPNTLSLSRGRHGEVPRRGQVSLWFEPVPPAGVAWIELRAYNGSVTRLLA